MKADYVVYCYGDEYYNRLYYFILPWLTVWLIALPLTFFIKLYNKKKKN